MFEKDQSKNQTPSALVRDQEKIASEIQEKLRLAGQELSNEGVRVHDHADLTTQRISPPMPFTGPDTRKIDLPSFLKR